VTTDASAISPEAAPRLLRRGLRGLRRRVRLLLALRFAAVGVAIVAGAAALVVLFFRLNGTWYPPLLPEAALGIVLLAAFLTGLVWPLPDAALAVSADRRLGLRDRIGSAVHFARAGLPSAMHRAEVADALRHLDRARSADGFPLRAGRAAKVAGLCLAVLFAVQLLPIPPLFLSPRVRQERSLLRKEAALIQPLAEKLEQAARESEDEEAEQVAQRLQKLAQQLDRGQLDKKQALLKLDQLDKDLERVEQRVSAMPPKTAADAAEELQSAARETTSAKAMELAQQAEKAGNQKLAEELKRLAEEAVHAQDAAELQDLAERLGDYAAQLDTPLRLPTDLLASLAQAFSGAEFELSEEALKELAEMAAEWPKELTQEELDALANELEALAKMLEDTEMADVAELLKEAAECLRAGDIEGAAKALAKCEGKLADCKFALTAGACRGGLLGILGGLRGSNLASPLRSPGARAGSGMGRGGPAPQAFIPPNAPATSLYAPRTTETSGTMERVRAQVRPGGPMVVTTEKGAPTRVDPSRVPYYEVITDYSKAAEEALSREEVPPTYRTTVRDYFDALQSGAESQKPKE